MTSRNPISPRNRGVLGERLPLDDVDDPSSWYDRDVENREPSSVVLEATAARCSPNRHQVLGSKHIRRPRNGKPEKNYVAPFAGAGEHHDGGHRGPAVCAPMRKLENTAQERVPVPWGIVQRTARLLVVTVVREGPRFPINRIRPIRIAHRRRQDDEFQSLERASIPETAHVAHAEQPGERVVASVTGAPPLVHRVDDQVAQVMFVESKRLHARGSGLLFRFSDARERCILYQYGYNPASLPRRATKGSATRGEGLDARAFGDAHAKNRLARKLNEIIDTQGLNQGEVAQLLRMPQPKVSAIRNYKLRGISLQRLMLALTALGQHVEIVVTPSTHLSPPRINVAA